jgi:hypothetical protein
MAAILADETIISLLANAISFFSPDGSSIAQNNNGKFTIQAAANDRFGIVKGQSNNTPLTLQNVSIVGGVPSINREQLEALIDNKIKAAISTINVRAVDNCIVGHNNGNGIITLPIRQVNEEPVNPIDGTMYLVNESNATNP